MKDLEIFNKNSRKPVFFGFLMIIFSILMILIKYDTTINTPLTSLIKSIPYALETIALVLFVVGLGSVLYYLYIYFSHPKPCLIINKDGIMIKPPTGRGFISRDHIEGFEEFVLAERKTKVILIKVKDRDYRINLEHNPLKRKSLEITFDLYGSNFYFNADILDIKVEELLITLNEYCEFYKK